MPQTLVALYLWIRSHPEQCGTLLYAAANVFNALAPTRWQRLPGWRGWLVRTVDRAVLLKQSDAEGTLSWPVFGRSVARAAIEAEVAPGTASLDAEDVPPVEGSQR